MRITTRLLLIAIGLLGVGLSTAEAGGWAIGVRIGVPVYCGPRFCGGYYYYGGYPYYPYPVVAPAPIYVQPAPVAVVQPAPVTVVQPAQPAPAQPAPAAATRQYEAAPAPSEVHSTDNRPATDAQLRQLADPSETVRAEAALQLGRSGAQRAIDPLAATLAGDHSPQVREAAARALGLIGSVKGLTALKSAAQSDSDRDVRKSAQFSIEVIQATLRR
jgi:hypothetical protein